MNKDQNLIFEAYTKSLTEDWQKGTSKAPKGKSFDMSRGGAPSNVDAARDGSGGRYRKTRPPSAQSNKTHSEMEEENEDFGNTNYDVDEPSVFERLEELMNSKPELEGVLKPILLEFEDALMEIDKIDINDFDAQEVFTSLARLYPF